MPLKILIVEDEKNLGSTLSEYLASLNYQVALATHLSDARIEFGKLTPNVVLLDIGLPDGSGLDLAKEFRKIRKDFVLLFLSAQNDPETKVESFEIGAEDYITKPFALKELKMRLDRILKANTQINLLPEVVEHGPLKIWFKRFEVQNAQGEMVTLSQKECAILELLYRQKGNAINREDMIEQIWGADQFPSNRTVDNYIVKLRKWCETDPQHHIEIQSIRSIGYKLITKA